MPAATAPVTAPAATAPVGAAPDHRTWNRWALTAWAVLAALAVCVGALFWTPLETPTAWRAASTVGADARPTG